MHDITISLICSCHPDILGITRYATCNGSVCRRPFFMKREQEDVSVVAPANARRVHGMSALMCLDSSLLVLPTCTYIYYNYNIFIQTVTV